MVHGGTNFVLIHEFGFWRFLIVSAPLTLGHSSNLASIEPLSPVKSAVGVANIVNLFDFSK